MAAKTEDREEKKEAPKLKVEVVEDNSSADAEVEEKVEETKAPGEEGVESDEEAKEEEKEELEEEVKEEVEEEIKEDNVLIGKKTLLIALFVAALVSLLVGGVLRFRTNVPLLTEETFQPTPTPAATEEPEASPSAEVSLADYNVQILNGSGVAGEAGVVEDLLLDAGFEDIETGNASSYDYTDTEVQVKEGTPKAVFEAIEEALGDYTVVEGDSLDEDSDFDVIVVVGERN